MSESEFFPKFIDTLKELGFHDRLLEEYREQKMQIRCLAAENLNLTEENAKQVQLLLEAKGKMPHVSIVMGEVRVLGVQGPNQFDPLVMNASLTWHIRELQAEIARLKGPG